MNHLKLLSEIEEHLRYINKESDIFDYEKAKSNYHKIMINSLIKRLSNITDSNDFKLRLRKLKSNIQAEDKEKIKADLKFLKSFDINTENKELKIDINLKLPDEIKDELHLDLKELEKCFNSKCYRASVILCGRIMEVAMFRVYYEKTGKDLLETAPGIGLSRIVGKLHDLGVKLPPGLSEQIHLIYFLRNSSVHKKQDKFRPSKEQANAMILYTIDALKNLFGK